MSDARKPTYDQLSALCAQLAAALEENADLIKKFQTVPHKETAAQSALTAHRTLSRDPQWQRVPEGCVVVPINPTMKMLAAAQSAWVKDDLKRTTTLWAAMLGARGEG